MSRSTRGDPLPPTRPGSVVGILERDRLQRFYPGLLALTLAFGFVEAISAALVQQPAFAAASFLTFLFAIGLAIAGRELRRGRPDRARAALAISLVAMACPRAPC